MILWRVNPEGYCEWLSQVLLDFTGPSAEEEMAPLFEPFHATKEDSLRLPICRTIVEAQCLGREDRPGGRPLLHHLAETVIVGLLKRFLLMNLSSADA
jgi:hypothetical protein